MPNAIQKPQYGARIDWSNPLTQGLTAAFFCSEGAGPPIDLVSGYRLSSTTGTVGWTLGSDGTRLLTDPGTTGASGYYATTPTYLRTTSMTVVWAGYVNATPAGNSTMFGVNHSASDSAPYAACRVGVDGTPNWAGRYNLGGSLITTGGTVAATTGPHWMALALTTRAQAFYVDSVSPATATTSGSIGYNAASTYGFSYDNAVRNCRSNHAYGLVYDRYLVQDELYAIRENPYGLLIPRRKLVVFGPPGGGGPTDPVFPWFSSVSMP